MRQQFGPAGAAVAGENFQESDRQYRKCGLHIQTVIVIHSSVSIVICILGTALGLLNVIYPELHHKSPVFRQIFKNYERTHHFYYHLCFKLTVVLWIAMHFVHLVTIIMTIMGLKMKTMQK
uniref:CNNM transmembrane domain-containing protein n=1 Tax=Steinernema glaseri TaxID=37863 RepID=A0A1I7YRZ8_9BILA